nr:AAA family ATPase [uncultured Blautia sp.]
MKPVVSIGNQDFRSIRENHNFYIDKTAFIKEWWENQDTVTLITRPRRFGKTLNMSMVENFFSIQSQENGKLFEGLKIWKDESYRAIQGSYPVIFLSFASVKGDTYSDVREGIVQTILDLYARYDYLRQSEALNEKEKAYFDYVKANMSNTIAAMALRRLSLCMNLYYGKKVLILLDEYDTPLQEAYVKGYWNELTSFMSSLFNYTFKTNPYMERGLLTGITRVSKESIFSDLNNLEIVTTTSNKYSTAFGFTEAEVMNALRLFGLEEQADEVKNWYDGFCFGSQKDIYNPWSITKYLDTGKFDSYWVNTSSNSLIGKLIQKGTSDIKIAMEDLLEGKTIETAVDEEIIFEQLENNCEAVWSLLLACGYLKVNKASENGAGGNYVLSLTNFEVKNMFRRMIQGWFGNASVRYNDFIKALLSDDIDYMNQYMNQVALQTFSFFDIGKKPADQEEPERFYHGFVLGLMVELADKYRITSNRESGLGRYDIVLEPLKKNEMAYVIEFKVHKPKREKDLQETAENALRQIEEKNYDAELLARGIQKEQIRHLGFAFSGKRVLIEQG